jgi:hypothetical protein
MTPGEEILPNIFQVLNSALLKRYYELPRTEVKGYEIQREKKHSEHESLRK